jgi:predicted nucleic acid-binding protein
MRAIVLDSFALIAYFRGEPLGARVKDLLHKAGKVDQPLHMSEINYAEVKYMILRKDGKAAWNEATEVLPALPIKFHPGTRELSDLAADFKSRFSISLADAFAAALAKALNAELVTGDPEFNALQGEIRITFHNTP